jgi:GT2 family glycosyltransferase
LSKKAILIPNFNGEKFIVNTVNAFIHFFIGYEIIVVDDASTDGSVVQLQPLNCKVIQRIKNGGFAAAINTGFHYLLEQNIDYVLVANSDLEIDAEVARKIKVSLVILEHNPTVAVLGFRELGSGGLQLNENISGFLFALRMAVFKDVGFFDETFYMYGEEQDFFRRIIKANYSIVQTDIPVPHHQEGSGRGLRNSWFAIRNALYLESKCRNWWKMAKVTVALLLIINHLYKPKSHHKDPSYQRITRPGILRGNYYLICALLWNIKGILLRK